MDKKIFHVYLAKADVPNNDAYATLDLPASPWELWDAMEKVRLKDSEELYMEIEDYLALTRAHIPVYLVEAQMLADRLAEKEKIGIVPEGVMPAYCGNWFPNERIIDFMNLPDENREKFLPFCTWYDEQSVTLLEGE